MNVPYILKKMDYKQRKLLIRGPVAQLIDKLSSQEDIKALLKVAKDLGELEFAMSPPMKVLASRRIRSLVR
jgi:hypothetical protein